MIFLSDFLGEGVWGPGVVPLDPDRHSVQNGGSFVSGALTATPFVPKLIFGEPAKMICTFSNFIKTSPRFCLIECMSLSNDSV